MTLKEKLISTTFISWAPLVFYLSTGVSSSVCLLNLWDKMGFFKLTS